jgi:hypothetical protein
MKPARSLLLIAAILSVLAAACSGATPGGGPGASSGAALNVSDPGQPRQVALPQLAVNGASFDGQRLLVTEGFLYAANGGQQVLCEGYLESYPPQPTGNQVGLVGQLPDLALQQLQSNATDPTAQRVIWGQISVIGLFHAASATSTAYIDMESIRVENGVRAID